MKTSSLWVFSLYHGFSFAYKAVVYTGLAAWCEDGLTTNSSCWDAAGWLLGNSSLGFSSIEFLNHSQLLAADLTGVDLYLQPGGGDNTTDYDDVWADMQPLSTKIRSYVRNGGRYLGICQGGYLAGNFSDTSATVGFNMFPSGILVDDEWLQNGTQRPTDADTTIQIDYTLANGTLLTGQWLFFQDGLTLLDNSSSGCSKDLEVVGQYTADQNIAAGLMGFGKGVLGLAGPHIEADASFWTEDSFTNPNNPTDPTNGYLIGLDFLKQLMVATPNTIAQNAAAGCDSNLGAIGPGIGAGEVPSETPYSAAPGNTDHKNVNINKVIITIDDDDAEDYSYEYQNNYGPKQHHWDEDSALPIDQRAVPDGRQIAKREACPEGGCGHKHHSKWVWHHKATSTTSSSSSTSSSASSSSTSVELPPYTWSFPGERAVAVATPAPKVARGEGFEEREPCPKEGCGHKHHSKWIWHHKSSTTTSTTLSSSSSSSLSLSSSVDFPVYTWSFGAREAAATPAAGVVF